MKCDIIFVNNTVLPAYIPDKNIIYDDNLKYIEVYTDNEKIIVNKDYIIIIENIEESSYVCRNFTY